MIYKICLYLLKICFTRLYANKIKYALSADGYVVFLLTSGNIRFTGFVIYIRTYNYNTIIVKYTHSM